MKLTFHFKFINLFYRIKVFVKNIYRSSKNIDNFNLSYLKGVVLRKFGAFTFEVISNYV